MPDNPDEQKKFANLHYPGMKADPDEGRTAISEIARWRFAEQIECLGEEAQRALLGASAFVAGATPVGIAAAQELLRLGIGRVGVYGDRAVSGASGIFGGEHDPTTVLPLLSRWAKANAPWARLEPFRAASIDRQLSDMARGFQFVVATGAVSEIGQGLALARELALPALAMHAVGRQAWCAFVPAGKLCEDCLEFPVDAAASRGLYFPLIGVGAQWIATNIVEAVLFQAAGGAFLESLDAARSPWMRETRELAPKAGCGKCATRS